MTTSKTFLFHLLILHIATSTTSYAQTFCPETQCPGSDITIRFPFGLKDGPNERCRYNPSFGLSCNDRNQTTITLPSGDYIVDSLDYGLEELWVSDPGRCLARRVLATRFTLNPPFQFPGLYGLVSYTFLNCTPNLTILPLNVTEKLVPVTCLSGQNYTIAAVLTDLYHSIEPAFAPCSVVSEALVPVQPFGPVFEGGGVPFYWDLLDCLLCEIPNEACGFLRDTGNEIGCSVPNRPEPKKDKKRWIKVAAAVAAPVVVILVFVFLVWCTRRARPQRTHQRAISLGSNHSTSTTTTTIITNNNARVDHTTTNTNGLDWSSIESYPKTVLLELRDPNNNTCSICLSEYKLGETIRTIPHCQHYFHVICIDDWLRKSKTCPLCRNIPNADGSTLVGPCLPSVNGAVRV